jgi:hypothetical protein
VVVHPDHPDAQLARDPLALEAVAGPHRRAQAGVAVVGTDHELVLVGRRLEQRDRPGHSSRVIRMAEVTPVSTAGA